MMNNDILKRYLSFGGIGLFIIFSAAIIISIIAYHLHPSRWYKNIAFIEELSESAIVIKIKLPNSLYGYTHIGLDCSMIQNEMAGVNINSFIINKNKNIIGVKSKGFYSGDVEHLQEVLVYSGSLMKFQQKYNYESELEIVSINNKDNDRNISIKIDSSVISQSEN